MWRLAKYLLSLDKAIPYANPKKPFSFGGKKCYTAVIWPVVDKEKNQFVLVMGSTNMNKEWRHFMSCNQENVQTKKPEKKNGIKLLSVLRKYLLEQAS